MPDFDRVLVLETASKAGQAALTANRVIIAETRLGQERRRASDLAIVVDRLFRDAGWEPRSLTAVVVGLGPGSYTGLRVGLASAKALTYATGCRFFGIETFAAIALRAPAGAGPVSVIADALQGRLFHRTYHRSEGGLEPLGPLEVISANEWRSKLWPGSLVTGPAAGSWEGKLPEGTNVVEAERREPRLSDALNVVRLGPWATTTNMWTAEPLYLRGSSAEEKAADRN
jgi:tRNA threonylcarbamoyladenosine biosynthesis protein TsaB